MTLPTKLLTVLTVLLASVALYATDRAFYYRNHPRVEIKQRNSVVYNHFDPNRSSAYTCTTQKVTKDVGMVCISPDKNVEIDCTVAGNPNQYFC